MHSITEHRDPPYIEVDVYGRYPEHYRAELEAVILRFANQNDAFGILETQHGKISNGLWRLLLTGGKVSVEMLAAFKKLKRYAVVSDEPGFLMRLIISLSRSGSVKFRLFKLHELDEARAWMRL